MLQYYVFTILWFSIVFQFFMREGRRFTTRETSPQSRAKVNQVDAFTSNQCDDVFSPPIRANACFTNPFHFLVSFIAALDTSSLMWCINWAKDLPMRVSLRIARSIFSTSSRRWLIGHRPRSKWAGRPEQNFFYHSNEAPNQSAIESKRLDRIKVESKTLSQRHVAANGSDSRLKEITWQNKSFIETDSSRSIMSTACGLRFTCSLPHVRYLLETKKSVPRV